MDPQFPKGFRLSELRIGILITTIIALLYFSLGSEIDFLNFLELKTLDLRFKVRGEMAPSSQVAIVAIDEQSIKDLGRWPWCRSVFADMVDRLSGYGARIIGFDLIFNEPEKDVQLQTMRQVREKYCALGIDTLGSQCARFYQEITEAADRPGPDEYFARAIAKSNNVVLPLYFRQAGKNAGATSGAGIESRSLLNGTYTGISNLENSQKLWFREPKELLPPLSILLEASKAVGFVNSLFDMDGSVRWEPMAIEYDGEYFIPFSLAVAREHYRLGPADLKIILGEQVEIGSQSIPLDQMSRYLINYYGPEGTFPYYSFSKVLRGEIPTKAFKGKIVLIGVAAAGLGDLWATPFSASFTGVEEQATLISNILQQTFIIKNKPLTLFDVSLIIICGLGLSLLIPRFSPLFAGLIAVVMLIFLAFFIQCSFSYLRIWVNAVYPLVTFLFVYLGITSFKYFTEEKEKRAIKTAFKQYLGAEFVEDLLKHPELLTLGGEKRNLTILFSDIRGFTALTEGMPPETMVALMNAFFSRMTDIVLKHGGLIDKYIGDSIMAIFGAPIPQSDHPIRACTAALEMVEIISQSHSSGERGFPPLGIGVGINSGPMVLGNMGSEKKFNYTVMGDNVNIASRIEKLNKRFGTSIIITENTYHAVKDHFICREIRSLRVRGRKQPLVIYELTAPRDGHK